MYGRKENVMNVCVYGCMCVRLYVQDMRSIVWLCDPLLCGLTRDNHIFQADHTSQSKKVLL